MCGSVFELAFLLAGDIINMKILAVTIFVLLEFRRSLAHLRVLVVRVPLLPPRLALHLLSLSASFLCHVRPSLVNL